MIATECVLKVLLLKYRWNHHREAHISNNEIFLSFQLFLCLWLIPMYVYLGYFGKSDMKREQELEDYRQLSYALEKCKKKNFCCIKFYWRHFTNFPPPILCSIRQKKSIFWYTNFNYNFFKTMRYKCIFL